MKEDGQGLEPVITPTQTAGELHVQDHPQTHQPSVTLHRAKDVSLTCFTIYTLWHISRLQSGPKLLRNMRAELQSMAWLSNQLQ